MDECLVLCRLTDEPRFEPRAEKWAPWLCEIKDPMLRVEFEEWKRY